MEKCYEYFNCKQTQCSRRRQANNNLQCWEVEDALCYKHSNFLIALREEGKSKIEFCKFCSYYKEHYNFPN